MFNQLFTRRSVCASVVEDPAILELLLGVGDRRDAVGMEISPPRFLLEEQLSGELNYFLDSDCETLLVGMVTSITRTLTPHKTLTGIDYILLV